MGNTFFSPTLTQVVDSLDTFFKVKKLAKDPAMSKFVPEVYHQTNIEWKKIFEPDFILRFNGLMIKGAAKIQTMFTAAFPGNEILQKFISQSNQGDLLFLHHPIILECGDPRGNLGRGFLPLNSDLLKKIIKKKLSLYSCHAPLDYHQKISTGRAIAAGLQATINSEFLPYGNGYAGLTATINPISTEALIIKLKRLFGIPYVDFAGKKLDRITKIGIVAGGGDEIKYSQTCRKKGAQAYITGEIFSHYRSDWGKQNTAKVLEYAKAIDFSLIGVSHAASEFLVMKTQIPKWLKENFGLKVVPLAQSKWWS
ncbi:MAG: Nif3-like dinuclear metal center hexameric protein [Candidatus Beckwithbacteria bacterium]|nr:Nif3-like dinuclear metal center hexameric protein [Candidatus Beckwithbacteria bacterium]